MFSSSSSSLIKPLKYDVFLSFRGEDTRNGFTSHLYKDLCQKKILTFIDDDKLKRGDEISPALLTAIEESRISVIIFSRNYASSKWCLDELVKIMDCKKTNEHYFVIPVFYYIDPSDVRKQTGSFADSFAKHEEDFKHNIPKVKTWRTTLREAANLSGWDSQVTRPESRLIDEIVKDILNKLNHGTSNCFEGLVGIERRMKKILSLLRMEIPDVLNIGIWGMGGIGKTTLAEAIFNQVSSGFQSSYFLANVRESEERGRLFQLRQEFLSGILEDPNLHISTPTIGMSFLKDRLSRKMVLVVCDDVSNSRQLEFLFGGIYQLGPGSRILITTRDKQVLSQNNIDLIYEVEELDEKESFQLFCQRAFKRDNPSKHQLQLSRMVLDFANGNPLAIKVIGSSLYARTYAIRKKLLRISYDALDREEKDIFLDMACFFKGEKEDHVTRIMDACYISADSGIQDLIDKSLINVSQNEISMHDLLQKMGWDVVCQESPSEPERRSRLWIPEDIYDVLVENTGTKTLKGILLDMSSIPEMELKPEAFAKMRKLKFLKFYLSYCYGSFQKKSKVFLPQGLLSLPDELRYLCWEGYPSKTLPTKFYPRNLVELDLSFSHVEQLWEGKQDLENLKVITLNHSENLIKIPDLSAATNLETMHLVNCANLLQLPSSLQYLEKLTRLNLRLCRKLKFLPSLYKVRSLTTLILSDCSNLLSFPEISSNVRELHLEGTAIEEVPSSVESLCQLTLLSVEECARLRNFPPAICNLRSLEVFSVSESPNITRFPEISGIIRELNLQGTAIEEVPSSIACLSELSILNLMRCRRLRSVSTSIYKLKSLKTLILEGCSRLEIFPEILETMERLKNLDLSGTALKELPSSIENLVGLREFRLNNCENLGRLPDSFYKLKSIRYLYLYGCRNLVKWPDNLCYATGTSVTSKLEMRNDLHWLSSLEILDLHGNNFENLPTGIKHLPKLQTLILRKCMGLKSLPELPASLRDLDAHDCTSLEEVSSIEKLFEQALLSKNKRYGMKFLVWLFSNCFKLDQHAVCNLRTPKLQELFRHMVTVLKEHHQTSPQRTLFITCVPGSEIPEWFNHKSLGSSITIQLPSEWKNSRKSFPGFIVATVVSFQDYSNEMDFGIRCEWHIKSSDGHCYDFSCSFSIWRRGIHGARLVGSNHLFLLYKTEFRDDDEDVTWYGEGQASECIYYEASFRFYPVVYRRNWSRCVSCEVKNCGVHLLFGEDEAERIKSFIPDQSEEQPAKRLKYHS
ncbi:hypothetical protein DITRI_Ditri01bG0157100 [Diplodiscus trichospermus]